jgi:hypothetical protein
MLAVALKEPLIAIESDEAKMLAKAVIEVGKAYTVNIDPRVLAWVNLFGAGVAVYGPRVFMITAQRKAKRMQGAQVPEEHTSAGGQVTRMSSVPGPVPMDIAQGPIKFE